MNAKTARASDGDQCSGICGVFMPVLRWGGGVWTGKRGRAQCCSIGRLQDSAPIVYRRPRKQGEIMHRNSSSACTERHCLCYRALRACAERTGVSVPCPYLAVTAGGACQSTGCHRPLCKAMAAEAAMRWIGSHPREPFGQRRESLWG
jgi:hypothetical protein